MRTIRLEEQAIHKTSADGIHAKEFSDPLGFATAFVSTVVVGAFGEHRRKQQPNKGCGADDSAPTRHNQLQETARNFHHFVTGLLVELAEDCPDTLLYPLINGYFIEVLSKIDSRVGNCEYI